MPHRHVPHCIDFRYSSAILLTLPPDDMYPNLIVVKANLTLVTVAAKFKFISLKDPPEWAAA